MLHPGLAFGMLQEGSPAANPKIQSDQHISRETTQDYNRRLNELDRELAGNGAQSAAEDDRIGPDDLLTISVFDAPELGHSVRVSAGGEIYLPLVGTVRAAGLAPHELEMVLEELLRRTYMKDPHVSVLVQEMLSHPVSVFGAVRKPGVYQIRGARSLIEILSLAEGLADDAGDAVVILHRPASLATAVLTDAKDPSISGPGEMQPGSGPQAESPVDPSGAEGRSEEVNLKRLFESGDAASNVMVYPGDVVKVARAGIVYVVGEVRRPGGFQLKSNENVSVLQAIALAEGLTHTSAKSHARIIRTDANTGTRTEIPLDLGKILAGKIADPQLQARDIVFVPNSASRNALYRGLETGLAIGTGYAIYRP